MPSSRRASSSTSARRAVARAVVDEHDLVRDAAQRLAHAAVELGEPVLLVVDGHDHGQRGRAHAGRHTIPIETPAGKRAPRPIAAASARIGSSSTRFSGPSVSS